MTEKDYPILSSNRSGFRLQLKSDSLIERTITTEFVLDLDWENNVIGVEIINLKFVAGACCLENLSNDIAGGSMSLRYSYDQECDAFSLTISDERSLDQIAVDGNIMLDAKGRIVALAANEE